eukprot:TRINITY_DN6055_c0_g1_i1.p1 TRINITY_DN6055_c0_g1~~TRINITY_DN6055_c0_g1_i1.p1  ORF type:complete len:229 (+),score=86.81 TRINITY_DN6055_c0_g1_i1:246-932(+)
MPPPPKRYFTANEVKRHNTEDDIWVSVLGKVLDLTPLIAKYKTVDAMPLIRAAGSDISHWFDPSADPPDMRRCVDVGTGLRTYHQPDGKFIHVPALAVDSKVDHGFEQPWWLDPKYVVGYLTKQTRLIRIVNTLNTHEITLEVCTEETLEEIQNRYLAINAHAGSYTWKRQEIESRELDMTKTLTENGIPDEAEEFERLGLPSDHYIPALHVYFNDDLTVDEWDKQLA